MVTAPALARQLGISTASQLPTPGARAAAIAKPIDTTFPVLAPLRPLFPAGGLRVASAVTVAGVAAHSLALLLLAAASMRGMWCGVAGVPTLSPVAAHELGIELSRLALAPKFGPGWEYTVGTLLEGLPLVVFRPDTRVSSMVASRLLARARQRHATLICLGHWPNADLNLTVTRQRWSGLGQGHGRLRHVQLTVAATGRGAAARKHTVEFSRPNPLAAK